MSKCVVGYDIVVVGGGMIGAAVALGLANQGFSIALVEADSEQPLIIQEQPDIRVSAVSYSSVTLLKELNCWQHVLNLRATPYHQLVAWEQGSTRLSFSAESLAFSELGFIVENRVLQRALMIEVEKFPNIKIYYESRIIDLVKRTQWHLSLSNGTDLSANLVIGADGANSVVRQLAGIGVTGWQYRQSCLLVTVKSDQPFDSITWQCFYPTGPKAFLPLHQQYATLVWYDHPERVESLSRLSLPILTQEILTEFPDEIGEITALAVGAFPLFRQHAQSYVTDGLLVIGDAAHAIHPLAGQGVNLGYRDVKALLKVLARAKIENQCWYSKEILMEYQKKRKTDNLLMQTGMDILYKLFSNHHVPFKTLRSFILFSAENFTAMKTLALKYALGLYTD